MCRTLLIAAIWTVAATAASAQSPAPRATEQPAVRLTVDEAVKMALDHNIDLAGDRLDPRIGDMRIAAANGAFRPLFSTTLQQNNQLEPPSSFLVPVPTRTNDTTTNVGITQTLSRFGTSYRVSWNMVHTSSNSFLNSFDPLVQSGLSLNLSQPLLRNLAIDPARERLATSRLDRDIASSRLRESVVRTTAGVKTAYWNLVTAVANVDARKSALDLSEELVRVNQAKVNVGQAPPLDLVAAKAEVAANQEQLVIAETTVKQVEDQLRALIFDTSDRSVWNLKIVPIDPPPHGTAPPDLDAAIASALRDRADLARARKDIDRAQVDVKFTENQRLPDLRVNASYLARGLGGTEVLRDGQFPGTVIGSGSVIGFGSVLDQLFRGQYSTWSVGLTLNYPIGQSVEQAEHARARLEHEQTQQRLKGAESRAIQQVRDAWRNIEMNAKRIETTRAARELAVERLDAERKRFDVGISTSFLVIQAQRDLAQARTNELAATLAYDLALVDFEALQQAGPDELGAAPATAAAVSAPMAPTVSTSSTGSTR